MDACIILVCVFLAIFILPGVLGVFITGLCAIFIGVTVLITGFITAIIIIGYSVTAALVINVFSIAGEQVERKRRKKDY